jgi:hypothetical protein
MRTRWFVSILLLAVLALSACDGLSGTQSAALRQKARDTTGCPTVTEGTQLLVDEAHGYCLLYPSGYQVRYPNDSEAVLFVGSLLSVDQPRASIKVQGAAGRTATQVADELVAEWSMGFDIQRTEVTVGGEQVIVLDNVPGQDTNRQVIFVHDGLLYTLTFLPQGKEYGEVYTRMEQLYATVVSSFSFLPQQ